VWRIDAGGARPRFQMRPRNHLWPSAGTLRSVNAQPYERLHRHYVDYATGGAASYTFDNLGQTGAKTDASGTTNYNWDAHGRMTSATLPSGQAVSYGYDALGRRASRTANGATTSFLHNGADVVLDKASDGSSVEYLNGGGIDNKLRQTSSSAPSSPAYFLQDHQGSTVALTDASGTMQDN
jgi:YD repeat-containing protein